MKTKTKKKLREIIIPLVKKNYSLVRHFVSVDDKTMLFVAYHGRGYNCNPKYIHQELLKDERFKDFNYIWAVKNTKDDIPGARLIKYNSLRYFYYLAKSKFWISNCKLPVHCAKKNDQIYINTWHGTPLKRLAHDINASCDEFYKSKLTKDAMLNTYDVDTRRYNYLVSPNSFTTQKYQDAFKVSKDIIREYGYPRNDFLVNLTNEQIENLKEKLNLPKDKKIILYCPTWRDDSFNKKGYTYELQCDFNKWHHYLSKDYVVIFKPHYSISNKFTNTGLEDFLYLADAQSDINELYAVSDMLITDYSSVFFDYSILDRPMLFYMYDLDHYRDNLRGFYLDIENDLPGQVVKYEEQLLKIIVNKLHEFDSVKEKRREFIKKYHSSEQGDASKKIIDNLIYPHI